MHSAGSTGLLPQAAHSSVLPAGIPSHPSSTALLRNAWGIYVFRSEGNFQGSKLKKGKAVFTLSCWNLSWASWRALWVCAGGWGWLCASAEQHPVPHAAEGRSAPSLQPHINVLPLKGIPFWDTQSSSSWGRDLKNPNRTNIGAVNRLPLVKENVWERVPQHCFNT